MSEFVFKVIKPIDWKELSDFFSRTWHTDYNYQIGAFDWDENYTRWSISRLLFDEDLLLGMYDGNKLIGVALGTPQNLNVKIEGEPDIVLKSLAMGFQTLDLEYRKKGLLHQLLNAFIAHAKKLGYDLITSFALKNWQRVLEKYNFSFIHKDPEFMVKFVSKRGVDVIREVRELNIALATLAKLLAGVPDEALPFGKIKDGSLEHADKILKLFNIYKNTLPIAQIWTEPELKQMLSSSIDYFKTLEKPSCFKIALWESDTLEILAVMIYDLRKVTFKNGVAHVHMVEFLAFDETVTDVNHKKGFVSEILRSLPNDTPVSIDTTPYNDLKARKSVKYDTDRDQRRFYVLPMTENGKKILALKNPKEFFLTNLE